MNFIIKHDMLQIFFLISEFKWFEFHISTYIPIHLRSGVGSLFCIHICMIKTLDLRVESRVDCWWWDGDVNACGVAIENYYNDVYHLIEIIEIYIFFYLIVFEHLFTIMLHMVHVHSRTDNYYGRFLINPLLCHI